MHPLFLEVELSSIDTAVFPFVPNLQFPIAFQKTNFSLHHPCCNF